MENYNGMQAEIVQDGDKFFAKHVNWIEWDFEAWGAQLGCDTPEEAAELLWDHACESVE